MNNFPITLSAIYIITLSGCTSQKTRLVQQGYPSAYAEGYYHGCREGKHQSNSHYNQRRSERIKTKTQTLITKILEENKDNHHLNLKNTSKKHQQSPTTQMEFKAIATELIPIQLTNTHQLFDNLSHGTQVKSRKMPTKQKLNTVSDYMYKNAHINTDWSERDFQYDNGWSDAFFICKTEVKAKATLYRRNSLTKYYDPYPHYNLQNMYEQQRMLQQSQQHMLQYKKDKKARRQQGEFQRQQNQQIQRIREQSTTIIPLPSIDKNQLIQQQLEWDRNRGLSSLERLIGKKQRPRIEANPNINTPPKTNIIQNNLFNPNR